MESESLKKIAEELDLKEPKRDTVGKISLDLAKQDAGKVSVIDQQRAMTEDYMKHLFECIDSHYDKFKDSFFIEVTTKMEPLMQNVLRNYFCARQSCPTPNYDQTLFRYNKEQGRIEFIWTIPSRDACHHLKENMLEVVQEEKELLQFVLMFADGTLFKLCKKFNNEKDASTIVS